MTSIIRPIGTNEWVITPRIVKIRSPLPKSFPERVSPKKKTNTQTNSVTEKRARKGRINLTPNCVHIHCIVYGNKSTIIFKDKQLNLYSSDRDSSKTHPIGLGGGCTWVSISWSRLMKEKNGPDIGEKRR